MSTELRNRRCPECRLWTLHSLKYCDPDDPDQGMVWTCTECLNPTEFDDEPEDH